MDQPLGALIWYYGTTLLLAGLLYLPIQKIIWVLRVRRMERKQKRPATEEDRAAAKQRARIVSGVIAITFAFLYNRTLN